MVSLMIVFVLEWNNCSDFDYSRLTLALFAPTMPIKLIEETQVPLKGKSSFVSRLASSTLFPF